MDVYDAPGPAPGELLAEYSQKAREDDKADALLVQQGAQPILKAGLFKVFRAYAGGFGALERVGPGIVRDDEGELHVRHLAARRGVYERLEVGAPAGDEHRRLYHSSTPPSPRTASPQI